MLILDASERLQADGIKGHLSDKVLGHCLILLESQRDEIKDVMIYMERGRYPALSTSTTKVHEGVLISRDTTTGI